MLGSMLYVSLFRMADDRNHAVVADGPHPKRNGTHRTVCGLVVGDASYRLASTKLGGDSRTPLIQCDDCLDGTSY